jgi:hypothetical protein
MTFKSIPILLLCVVSHFSLSAQTTTVSGRIFNGESGRALPFVSVSFSGTSIGTMTDSKGQYKISSEKKVSRINVSFIGYQSQSISIQKQVSQKIDIALEPKRIELKAAEVRPDKKKKNPAKPLMQRVAQAKKQNDPNRITAISFNFHERLELDLNDIPSKLPGRKLWGAFGWVWDNLDSSEARVNLPVFFTESSGTIRTQKKPRRVEKRIEAARATWLEDGQSTSSVSSEFLDINLYENQLLLMDKAFTSPLHDRGSLHYRYYILDTLDIETRPTFHLAFVPRRRGEFTFEGELWIDTLTLGLKKVEAKISEGANLNFIRSFNWQQDYELINDTWVLGRQEDIVDISPTGGGLGFYARATKVNYDFEFAQEWPDSVWVTKRDLSFAEGSNDVLEEIWEEKRPETLLTRESSIYHMADSVTSMPQFKLLSGLLYGLGSGFVQFDKFELGPWYDSYSRNAVEGHRIGLGVQTSNDFSRTLWLSTFAAYGTKDQEWKYGADITWIQRKLPRIEWYGSYQKDIEQLGMMGFFDQGNIFNSALSLEGDQDQLSLITQSEGSLFIEYGAGLSTFIELRHRKVDPKGSLEFPLPQNPDGSQSLTTAESTLQLRYAHQEKFVSGAFERISLGSRAPIVTLSTTQGWKGIAGSQFRYGRYTLGLEGKLRWGALGRVEWNTEAGMYSGSAPFPLMELQPANETAISIQPAFNLLRYFEFVTDRWVRGMFEWHGEGAILGHIPLIRRLELREIVGIKAVYGSWDTDHEEIISLPETTTGLDGMYAEAVFGLENIFHFLRVDAHLRLTETEEGMRKNFGIRVGIAVEL